MTTRIEAVYEGGVLRPTQPIPLADGAHVEVIVISREPVTEAGTPAEILDAIAAMPMEPGGEESTPAHGAIGVVVAAPADHAEPYRVRFPDGAESRFRRAQLTVFRQVQRDVLQPPGPDASDAGLFEYVIYRCVVGSRAYGLERADSDTDRRGIYLPPAALHWSLAGVPEVVERRETQEHYWELQRFLTLALKANPNVLECLYTPLVELATPLARELLAMRSSFLSRLVYQTYNGYAMSQFKKLEQDLRTRGTFRWKHVVHLVRQLLAGITVLEEGFVPVRVDEHRERLLTIGRGEVPWEDVDAWRLSLHRQFDAAFAATRLPERPDYARVNAFLLEARRSMV